MIYFFIMHLKNCLLLLIFFMLNYLMGGVYFFKIFFKYQFLCECCFSVQSVVCCGRECGLYLEYM